MPQRSTTQTLLSVVDLALRERMSYSRARDAILCGKFGPVERVGGRIYVRMEPKE